MLRFYVGWIVSQRCPFLPNDCAWSLGQLYWFTCTYLICRNSGKADRASPEEPGVVIQCVCGTLLVTPSTEKGGFVCWNAALWPPFVVRKQNISRVLFISSQSESLRLVSRITSEKCSFCQLNTKVVQTSSIDVGNCISADDSCLLTSSFWLQCQPMAKIFFNCIWSRGLPFCDKPITQNSSTEKSREESCFLWIPVVYECVES